MSAPSLPDLLVAHWQLSPVLWAQAGVAVALYLGAAARLRGRWPLRHCAAFLAGVASLVVALQSGIDSYDDSLLSVHMVQHMILLLLAPLLLLLGRPMTLALRVTHGERRRALARALERARPLTRPWWCVLVYTLIVLGVHLPPFFDATLAHPLLHDTEHGLFLVAGLLLWWPLIDGDPVLTHRLGGLARLLYLLASMLPMALIGAYLNRQPSVVYAPYATAGRALGVNPVHDQAIAGAIMWVVGDMIMILVGLWAVMAALSDEERRQEARESYTAPAAWRGPGLGGGAPR